MVELNIEQLKRRRAEMSWKRDELLIMRRLGGERIPVNGRRTSSKGYQPDGEHPWLAVSIKSRKAGLVVIQSMMSQAVKAAQWIKRREGKDKLPLGVYHVVGTHYDNALVVMRLADFEAWFGGAYESDPDS